METNKKVYVTAFCGIAIAVNIVLGIITSALADIPDLPEEDY